MENVDQLRPIPLNLDWEAYYEMFVLEHGGNPVAFGNRLLFQDGWTYSLYSREGPEWPPPKDERELRALQIRYWELRKSLDQAEGRLVQQRIDMLEELQSLKSAPLQQVSVHWDEEEKKRVVERGPVDLSGLQGRLGWLEDDVDECNHHLAELRDAYKSKG